MNDATTTNLPQTGQLLLDDDHDELCRLIDGADAAPDAELPAHLSALQGEFARHFAVEDRLMAPHDFSSRQCHLDEHAAVLASFDGVLARLPEGDTATARRMVRELRRWLPEHIDALDRHLAKFIFHRRTGGAPVQIVRR